MNLAKRNYSTFLVLLLSLIFIFLATAIPAAAAQTQTKYIVNMYFFWGDGCPHCADQEVFLEEMTQKYGNQLVIHDYELWYHPENQPVIEKFAEAYGFKPTGVPVTFIGNEYWVGFNVDKQKEMERAIRDGIEGGVVDAQDIVDGIQDLQPPAISTAAVITLPLIGEINLENRSLLFSTIIIGLVDGVNPCSLWVLTMLLAMTVRTHSRKKTIIIGLVFLTVTAAVYALFIAGVFTILTYVSYMKWIQIGVAILTLILGAINLKDYFFYKEGVSLTIQDSQKPGIYQKMRNVMNSSENVWAMIGATIALGLGVSLVEFSCTAAFPVIWSNLLVSQNASTLTFVLLLLLYMLIYQLDELIIFFVVVFTMKSSRMEEKHGQILKLFSGCLMVTLSLVMIIKPAWMNDLGHTLLVFGFAVLLTLFVLLLASKILPEFGIYIGHKRPKQRKGAAKKK